ncbi:hypothetical protein BGZ96_005399 [Linnemannia gamsii]|uniref:Uncharacterized protein n=1 Tax=Linnemannia gamsii TaxID=64522 RepID=A0ABQ7K5A8_9FUNG|nr:hypothetical protein BGZ96_005399 [Linnemannia gamsii]
MSLKIPAYTNPCLSPSFYINQPKTIFLFAVPDGTPTLVSHIVDLTDIYAPMVTYIASNSKTDPLYEWDSMTEKSCFTNPLSSTSAGAPAAYTSTEVQQFGPRSSGALLLNTNELNQAYDLPIVQFRSSRLFATTQVRGPEDFTVAWVNFTSFDPVSNAKTVKSGCPQGFDSLPLTASMLAVGAYSTTNASGFLALFDKDGVGSLYTASSVVNDPATNSPLSWLFAGPKRPIDNGGAKLTPDAVAISAQGVAYILDQAENNLTVVYLRPNTSNWLVMVVTNGGGGLPLFNKNMVGMILQEPNGSTGKIVIYSLDKSTGVAKFNLLDTITGIWTGGTEPSATATSRSDSSDDDQLTDSLVIIIGGVAGALCLLLAIVLSRPILHPSFVQSH